MLNLFMGKKNRCDRGDHIIAKIGKINWFQNLVVQWLLKTSSGSKHFKGATNDIIWDFPWLAVKKDHEQETSKSCSWQQRLIIFLQFLYCPEQPCNAETAVDVKRCREHCRF